MSITKEKKKYEKFHYNTLSSNEKPSILKYRNSKVQKKSEFSNLKSKSISTKENTSILKKPKIQIPKIYMNNLTKSPEIRRNNKLENINNKERLFKSFIIHSDYIPLTKEEKIEQFESIKLQSDRRLHHYDQIFKKIGNEINEIHLNLSNYAKTTENRFNSTNTMIKINNHINDNDNDNNNNYINNISTIKNVNSRFNKSENSSKSNFNSSFDSNSNKNKSNNNITIIDSINLIDSKILEQGDSNINPELIEEHSNRQPIYIHNCNFDNNNYKNKYYNYNKKKFKEIFFKKDILKIKDVHEQNTSNDIIYNTSKSNIDISNNISNCYIKCCRKEKEDKNDQCNII